MYELGSHHIHSFDPNIDATKEQQQLHPSKITLEVSDAQHFNCLNGNTICQCGMQNIINLFYPKSL